MNWRYKTTSTEPNELNSNQFKNNWTYELLNCWVAAGRLHQVDLKDQFHISFRAVEQIDILTVKLKTWGHISLTQ